MPCPLCPKINRWLLSQLLQISRSTKFDFVKYQRGEEHSHSQHLSNYLKKTKFIWNKSFISLAKQVLQMFESRISHFHFFFFTHCGSFSCCTFTFIFTLSHCLLVLVSFTCSTFIFALSHCLLVVVFHL